MGTNVVTVTVNGSVRSAQVEPRTLLSDFIRTELGLTGTHVGCEQGVCGACTILLDGVAVRSCLLLAHQVDGLEIETVENLATDATLSGIQESMMVEHGLQCGFCTPGILISLSAAERSGLSADYAIEHVLAGHVCRCTGYVGIRAAIERQWQKESKDA